MPSRHISFIQIERKWKGIKASAEWECNFKKNLSPYFAFAFIFFGRLSWTILITRDKSYFHSQLAVMSWPRMYFLSRKLKWDFLVSHNFQQFFLLSSVIQNNISQTLLSPRHIFSLRQFFFKMPTHSWLLSLFLSSRFSSILKMQLDKTNDKRH